MEQQELPLPEHLRDLVTRAIQQFQLSQAAGLFDVATLVRTAVGLLPRTSCRSPVLVARTVDVAIVGGPFQCILKPHWRGEVSLIKALHQQALFGELSIFDGEKGVKSGSDGAGLILDQDRGAVIRLDEHGSLLVRLPLSWEEWPRRRVENDGEVIIEEVVVRHLMAVIALADWVLERIDPTRRLTQVAIAVNIDAGRYFSWVTQTEEGTWSSLRPEKNPRGEEFAPIHVNCRRDALRYEAKAFAEDLVVSLRGQHKSQQELMASLRQRHKRELEALRQQGKSRPG